VVLKRFCCAKPIVAVAQLLLAAVSVAVAPAASFVELALVLVTTKPNEKRETKRETKDHATGKSKESINQMRNKRLRQRTKRAKSKRTEQRAKREEE